MRPKTSLPHKAQVQARIPQAQPGHKMPSTRAPTAVCPKTSLPQKAQVQARIPQAQPGHKMPQEKGVTDNSPPTLTTPRQTETSQP